MKCHRCKSKISDGAIYCPHCGVLQEPYFSRLYGGNGIILQRLDEILKMLKEMKNG